MTIKDLFGQFEPGPVAAEVPALQRGAKAPHRVRDRSPGLYPTRFTAAFTTASAVMPNFL